jgi:Protein of unknown function (DUF3572)
MDKRPIFQKTPGAGRAAALAAGYGHQVSLDRNEAETIALRALGFVAEDEDRIGAFMGETGISPDDLREQATSPAILTAVLDYLTRDESLLLMFAANADIQPERITPALMLLNGDAGAEGGTAGSSGTSGAHRPSKIMQRR